MIRAFQRHHRLVRSITVAVAAAPLLQGIGCYPNFLGAINFELQSLIVSTFSNAFSIVVANFLHL